MNATQSAMVTTTLLGRELIAEDGPIRLVRKDQDRGSLPVQEPWATIHPVVRESGQEHRKGNATKAFRSNNRTSSLSALMPSSSSQNLTTSLTPQNKENNNDDDDDDDNDSSTTKLNQKIMLLITTHLSEQHIRYFDCCWPRLLEGSQLLGKVDVTIFTNFGYKFYNPNVTSRITALFSGNPRVFYRNAPTKLALAVQNIRSHDQRLQRSANIGLQLGFQEGWFSGYDWLIRINPDVVVRNSTWLLETMTTTTTTTTTMTPDDQPGVDGIFVRCNPQKFHTDFFAVRPLALVLEQTSANATSSGDNGLPFSELINGNHEMTAATYFRPILDSGRYALLPDAAPSRGHCRVRGAGSSVFHDHKSCTSRRRNNEEPSLPLSLPEADENHGYGEFVCDALEGWTIT
eukprot:jgi/Psemu1/6791/gm1.6791_g